MLTEWIVIETIAVLVDGITFVYFINSRFSSKKESQIPQISALLCLIGWGLIATFLAFPSVIYDGAIYVLLVAYLLLTKRGTLWQKLFGVALTFALSIGISLAGAGLASFITNVNVEHTLIYQDSTRLLAIILIKSIQIVVFYLLAKKHYHHRTLEMKPLIVLGCIITMVFSCLLFMFSNLSELNEQSNNILIWLSVGALLILVGVFLMYELFAWEAERIADLSRCLQRLEMESEFNREICAMHSDLRTWRHEYNNNLIALRAVLEEGTHEDALEYLDSISIESVRDSVIIQTGNTVLDAVVSSKLLLARSYGIDVSVQAVYLNTNIIEDKDICAIIGNLLDNATEACERMEVAGQIRYLSFSLFVKGKNLAISVLNSYDGKIKRDGNKYLTSKGSQEHGIGLQNVDSIVAKYQGHVVREYHDGVFETHVLIPLISEK